MKVAFGGDVFLGGDLQHHKMETLFASRAFSSANYRIVNLEHPLSDNSFVAQKGTLYAGSKSIRHLSDLGITAVNLANNHIHDKGDAGILETISHLKSCGIGCFGAGANLAEARAPFRISDRLYVLGYCDFDKPYLRQVQVATPTSPGINPLRRDSIESDLASLPEHACAILFFHWGREHVFLPSSDDIALGHAILSHHRVVGIVGTHSHRIQGSTSFGPKRIYYSVGNFLFPNFWIAPPMQLVEAPPSLSPTDKTRRYHPVFRITYKTWSWINRASLVVTYDSESGAFRTDPVLQSKDAPHCHDLIGFPRLFLTYWIQILSLAYRLPKPAYDLLEWCHTRFAGFTWEVGSRMFYVRQEGFLRYLGRRLGRHKK